MTSGSYKKKPYGRKAFVPHFPMSRIPRGLAMTRYNSNRREIKYCDIAEVQQTIRVFSTPPTAQCLNFPVQGSAPYNRVGSKLMNKSIRIRFQIVPVATNASTDFLRVILFYDRQTNGSAPAWADLIKSTTSAAATASNCLDGINMDNRERFKVLRDQQIQWPTYTYTGGVISAPGVISDTPPNNQIQDWYVKLHGLETHYKATAGAVGDIATGGLFLIATCLGNDATAAIVYSARLRFDDL